VQHQVVARPSLDRQRRPREPTPRMHRPKVGTPRAHARHAVADVGHRKAAEALYDLGAYLSASPQDSQSYAQVSFPLAARKLDCRSTGRLGSTSAAPWPWSLSLASVWLATGNEAGKSHENGRFQPTKERRPVHSPMPRRAPRRCTSTRASTWKGRLGLPLMVEPMRGRPGH
jgi:hypothetical protein